MQREDPWSAISSIAEKRIEEARDRGELDNLPGQGKPLELEDLSHVPPELRMAYKLLHNAGCLPPELAERKEINSLLDMLETCSDEHQKLRQMQKLRYRLEQVRIRYQRPVQLEEDDPYYAQVLARLARVAPVNKKQD